MKRRVSHVMPLVCASWLAAASQSNAADTAGDSLRIARDAEQVELPLPHGSSTTLLVELDGYDVTAVVRMENDVLTLPTRKLALEPGPHVLRVLKVSDNGDIDPLLERELTVEGDVSSSSHASWGLLVGSAWRMADEPAADFAARARAEHRGTFTWEAERHVDRWTIRGSASALYDNIAANTEEDRVWNSPEYQLEVGREIGTGRAALGLGDDTIGLGNLLFSAYTRRGLRLDVKSSGERMQVHAFTLNSEPLTRLDADFVPASATGSVQGGYTVFSLTRSHPEWLQLTAGFVSGDTTLDGVATSSVDFETRYGGQAYNAALDSWTAGGGLWLHAETARSSFDSDGLGVGDSTLEDDATDYMAQWSSSGGLALPGLDEWALGFESQRVGAHFFSLGNLALPGDLAFEHVYTRISTHGLQLSADEARYHSDLDDDPLRAKRHGHTRGVAADYTPLAIDPTRGVWRVFGMPTLSAEWKDVTWRQRPEDAPLVGFDVNSRSRTHSFGIDFSRDIFTLSLHRDATRFDDETQTILVDDFEIYTPSPDTRELAYSVQLGWTPSQRLTIAPQVQLTRLREVESGARSRSVLWGLQAQAVLMPARLWLRTSFSETRDRMELSAFTDSTQSLTSGGGTAALVYRARGARDLSPALDLRLTGHYARGFTHDTWQAMFGFAVNWQRAAQ